MREGIQYSQSSESYSTSTTSWMCLPCASLSSCSRRLFSLALPGPLRSTPHLRRPNTHEEKSTWYTLIVDCLQLSAWPRHPQAQPVRQVALLVTYEPAVQILCICIHYIYNYTVELTALRIYVRGVPYSALKGVCIVCIYCIICITH